MYISKQRRVLKMETAKNIIEQIGGNRFMTMTGATIVTHAKDGIVMKIGRNKIKANMLEIKVNSNDTYTMKFFKLSGVNFKEIKQIKDVFCSMLVEVFETETGLVTSL
jgi:hypothetical protein